MKYVLDFLYNWDFLAFNGIFMQFIFVIFIDMSRFKVAIR